MSKTADIINSFELILKENASNQQSTLYSSSKYKKIDNESKPAVEVDKVLSNVSRQIRAIQSADCYKHSGSATLNINKYKKLSFIPVNMLSGARLMSHNTNTNKFETQCVTDTQLINIVQDAEELVSHRGMTQEFDTTFYTQEANNISSLQINSKSGDMNDENNVKDGESKENNPVNDKEPIFPIIDISLKKPGQNDDVDSLFDEPDGKNDKAFTEMENHTQTNMASTEINKKMDYDFYDRDLSSSPVFNVKTVNKSVSPQPLVFELEAFEKFEKLAIPVVEENTDKEAAKCLIYSQILGKELYLQSESEPHEQYQVSPVIECNETKFNFDQVVENLPAKDNKFTPGTKSIDSSTLKDEILFSSDEENECGLQQYLVDDLPFTCALATSFYELPDVLDKTMYVGFQTASNKSIQVCTESFYKAKSILDDFEKDVSEKPSLTELVKMCDEQNSVAIDFGIKNGPVNIKNKNKTECYENLDFPVFKDEETNPVHQLPTLKDFSEKSIKISQPYEGFKTASNKKICLSETALQQTQKIFMDIDLSENCVAVNKNEMNCINNDRDSESETTEKKSIVAQVTVKDKKELNLDDSIILEFENNDMSHENNDKCISKDLLRFKTASNKDIRISHSAFEKTKNIFQDIDATDIVCATETTNTDLIKSFKDPNMGFKTASNKEIKISDQAVLKTKNIFQDIAGLNDKYIDVKYTKKQWSNIDLEKDQPSTSTGPFFGFKTASNKEIKISDVALVKTKMIFNDIDNDDFLIDKKYVNRKSEYPNPVCNKRRFHDIDDKTEKVHCPLTKKFQGFRTANNKRIKITEETLMRSRKIFEEMEKDTKGKDHTNNLIRNQAFSSSKAQFGGFQTASNKPVNISNANDALTKNKAIFQKIVNNNDANQSSSNGDIRLAIFKGFQTASNKSIKISEQALIDSKKIFENIDVNEFNVTNSFKGLEASSNKLITVPAETIFKSNSSKLLNNNNDEKEETPFKGFQSPSNKKIKISQQALARSKEIFDNIDTKSVENYTHFKGFQTASSKKINISAQALARSKKILENIDIESESYESVKLDAFQGFLTANNKKVNISEKALAISKRIFENIDQDKEVHDIAIKSAFQGLHTGNNMYVKVSENCVFNSPKGSPFRGFQTASNREFKISKEALAKTKGIFQDINITSDTTENAADIALSQVIPVKSANNSIQNSSKDSCREKERNLANPILNRLVKQTTNNLKEAENNTASHLKSTVTVENVIDTQVMNDFDKSLHTEDFSKAITPEKSKRSGSPILSCPKAKRRKKFETPYNKTQKNIATPLLQEKTDQHDIKTQTHIFDISYKKNKKYNLNDINNIEKEGPNTKIGVDPYILGHNNENLLKFQFYSTRNELSNERWTTDDLKKYFLSSVNKNLVPDGWIDNHLKLIIWKLISYEIKFQETLGLVCTAKNVIEQLKYRYDKELFNSERPALRKIMEKDDVSTKLMVLCVAAVYDDGSIVDKENNQKPLELLVTDGWYCVKACLDKMLSKMVIDGKIAVGSKIVTSGAELVGCEQGVAPWEDTSQVRLKLSGNSTRRARWYARLGYHGNGSILTHLRDVQPDGGRVARLRVFVARVYPTLYIEKFDDGSTVTRSERLELLHQMKHDNERQGLLEKLYEEVQKEFSDEESQDSEVDPELKGRCLDSGSQLAKAMKMSKDPAEFRTTLTETQVELLNEHTTRKRDRLIQNIQARVEERIAESGLGVRRNVVSLMKIRIADVRERGNIEVTKGLMSIWKPNDAITEIVKEGSWVEVINVIPTAIRYSEIQISAGRQSIFSQSRYKEIEKVKPYTKSMRRSCYPLKDLAKNPSMTTEYNEIDTVGLIFLIEPSIKEFDSNKNQFQNVYLADADKNIICVNFWGGLKKLGFENILDTGQVITCMNLQKRAGNTRKNIPQYRVTEFTYFTKTPKNDTARNVSEDLDKKLQGVDRIKFCDDCVTLKNNFNSLFKQNNSENVSPYRCQNIYMNLSKNKMFIESPLVAKSVKKDENLNLSGLDFESTFRQIDTQEYSPKTLLRKRQIKEKINKLKMYGEPPALSPVQILNKSKNAGSAFKSPLPKSKVPKSVANVSEIQLKENNIESHENPGSPVIMNRTFVKRTNVNPVKLDFSSVAVDDSNISDTIDHFAEEFDGSPPLSLD